METKTLNGVGGRTPKTLEGVDAEASNPINPNPKKGKPKPKKERVAAKAPSPKKW